MKRGCHSHWIFEPDKLSVEAIRDLCLKCLHVICYQMPFGWIAISRVLSSSVVSIGVARRPMDEAWVPLTLDLRTGQVVGGSYTGPLPEVPSCDLLPDAFWLDRDFPRVEFERRLDR